jgi:hypothetical protein
MMAREKSGQKDDGRYLDDGRHRHLDDGRRGHLESSLRAMC